MEEYHRQTKSTYNNKPINKPIKRNLRLIKIVITLIIIGILIIIAGLLFLFQDNPTRFYGTWELETLGFNLGNSTTHNYWTFYENGTFKITKVTTSFNDEAPIINFEENNEQGKIYIKKLGPISEQIGSYEVRNGKLYISGISDIEIPIGIGLDYNFVNNDHFVINFIMFQLNFERTIESAILETTYNFENIEWKNINISLSVGYGLSETIYWDQIKLTRASKSYYGEHAPFEWGYIQIGDEIEIGNHQTVPIIVRVTWIPTEKIIGTIFCYIE